MRLQAKARQMRPTLEIEMPLCRAMLRVLHCVAVGGWLSNVWTMTLSTLASSILRGTPGRGSSSSPLRPRSTKRRRHFPTVCAVTRSRAATALLLRPAAQPNTIRARNAKACAVLRRCVSPSRMPASSPDNSILATGRPVRIPHPGKMRIEIMIRISDSGH
jgi:hypothetical protein